MRATPGLARQLTLILPLTLPERVSQQVQQVEPHNHLLVIVYRLQFGAADLQHVPRVQFEPVASRNRIDRQTVLGD